jgi:hypothetical protein
MQLDQLPDDGFGITFVQMKAETTAKKKGHSSFEWPLDLN